jgi:hypothetical protein
MGVGNRAGGYIIEYIVFILFSVSRTTNSRILERRADFFLRSFSLLWPPSLLYAFRLTQNSLASQRSRLSLVASLSGVS